MVSLQTLPVEIGEHIATYIRFDEVQILSKLSRHFRANWTFFTSFAFHVAYLKNPLNKNILDRSCFHLAHPTLIAAWLCHGDISDGMVSLTHCDSYPCMDRSKAEERTKSGQPCRRHSQRMTAALKVAMANGLPNEFLKNHYTGVLLIHHNILHTFVNCESFESLQDSIAKLPNHIKDVLSSHSGYYIYDAVRWNSIDDVVFLFALKELTAEIPQLVVRAVAAGHVEALNILFEFEEKNPETAGKIHTIFSAESDDMFDIVVSHPKLSPAEFITEHTEFFLENVMLAYIRVGNIAKLKAILEKHVPEFLCVKYTNTLEMLDFVMNLSSVSIDAAAFVLQCCKKNNVTMLLALDEKLSLNSATVAATILQSPNFDSIILDDKIPASWREAFVRLFLDHRSKFVPTRHGQVLNELIESGGLEVSDNEKEEARLVCAVSTGKAESVEYKNRALRIVFERCDVEAVKALLVDLDIDPLCLADRTVLLTAAKKDIFFVLDFLLHSWPGTLEGFLQLLKCFSNISGELAELSAKDINEIQSSASIDILNRLLFLRDTVLAGDISTDDLKGLLRIIVQNEKFARTFGTGLNLQWIGVASLFLDTCPPEALREVLDFSLGTEDVAVIADLLTYTLSDVKPGVLAVLITHERAGEWVCDHHLEMGVGSEDIKKMIKGVKRCSPWLEKASRVEMGSIPGWEHLIEGSGDGILKTTKKQDLGEFVTPSEVAVVVAKVPVKSNSKECLSDESNHEH